MKPWLDALCYEILIQHMPCLECINSIGLALRMTFDL